MHETISYVKYNCYSEEINDCKMGKTGTNDGVLTFSIEQAEIQKGLTTAFNKVKGNLNVPGFRKGKVSRQVFNRMYEKKHCMKMH